MESEMKDIKGFFDGKDMLGEDGKLYPVPSNYASKSKLVEGDEMRLRVTEDGSFIYKQIREIPRRRVIVNVTQSEEDGQLLFIDPKTELGYRVLTASISFYRVKAGDEAILIVPKEENPGYAGWGALEGVITVSKE